MCLWSCDIDYDVVFRWKLLQVGVDERYKHLRDFGKDGAPPNQSFLSASVDHPWERATTQTRVPYYIKSVQMFYIVQSYVSL